MLRMRALLFSSEAGERYSHRIAGRLVSGPTVPVMVLLAENGCRRRLPGGPALRC
jgi:hypothetical protein